MDEDQLTEIIINTKKWHDSKIEQLKELLNTPEDVKIQFQGENGEMAALPEINRKAFLLGISIAIEVIGKFPVSITASKNTKDD